MLRNMRRHQEIYSLNAGIAFICGLTLGCTLDLRTTDLSAKPDSDEKSPAISYTYSWTKTFGGNSNDWIADIGFDSNEDLYILGVTQGTMDFAVPFGDSDIQSSNGDNDAYLTKVNSDGSYAWTRTFGGTNGDPAHKIAIDANNNIYILGEYQSPSVNFAAAFGGTDIKNRIGNDDVSVTKINSDGTYGWTRAFHHSGIQFAATGLNASQDAIYIAGRFHGTGVDFASDFTTTDLKSAAGSRDAFVTKITFDGTYGYTTTMGGTDWDEANHIALNDQGDIFILGKFSGTAVNFAANFAAPSDSKDSNGGSDLFLTKILNNGSYAWTKTFGGSANETSTGLAIDEQGNVYISGTFSSTDINFASSFSGTDTKIADGKDTFITRINADNSYGWTKVFGESGNETIWGLTVSKNNKVIATGEFQGTDVNFAKDFGGEDFRTGLAIFNSFIVQMTTDGKYERVLTFDGNSFDSANGIKISPAGDIFLFGFFYDTLNFARDFGAEDIQTSHSSTMDSYLQKINVNK